ESRGYEAVAGVAPWLAQFLEDVVERVNARRDPAAIYFLQQSRLFDQPLYRDVQGLRNLFHHGVRLRMHRRHIERMFAVTDPQKSGGLLECLWPDPGHRRQLNARTETTLLVAILHNLLCGALIDSRYIAQQRPRRRIQFHAHPIDATLNHA